MSRKIILCYGKTKTSPGRYLEHSFRKLGVPVSVVTKEINGRSLNPEDTMGIIFIETIKAPKAVNMNNTSIPVLYWIHHGQHKLQRNLKLIKQYKPDRILMSHSLHLAKKFPVPVIFFPFGVAEEVFHNRRSFKHRKYGVAFVGSSNGNYYSQRNRDINRIRHHLRRRGYPYKFVNNVSPEKMAQIYGKAKIVYNRSSEKVPQTINMRIFEGIGCGALVLTNKAPLQSSLFKDRVHYIVYKNSADMIRKLKFYLARPALAERIANQGYREAKNRHTYDQRAKKVLDLFKQIKKK
jgi:spore maturation protein CgeB